MAASNAAALDRLSVPKSCKRASGDRSRRRPSDDDALEAFVRQIHTMPLNKDASAARSLYQLRKQALADSIFNFAHDLPRLKTSGKPQRLRQPTALTFDHHSGRDPPARICEKSSRPIPLNKLNLPLHPVFTAHCFISGCGAAIAVEKNLATSIDSTICLVKILYLTRTLNKCPRLSMESAISSACISAEWRRVIGKASRQSPATTGRL
jgi:hypothetical protein